MRFLFFLFSLSLFVFSCSSNKKASLIVTNIYDIDSITYWQKVSPIMFMDTLKKHPFRIFVITVSPQENWYDQKYVEQLKHFSKDRSLCAAVISSKLNMRPVYKRTTVSQQREYLIKGINEKRYPPTLSSIHGY